MQLPGPVRAAIGLAANVADEARRLPDRAIEVPMLAVSTVLQMSLRAQQRYARLTARGDEILSGAPSDDPPPWATFDDPVPADDPADDLRSLARDQLGDSSDAAKLLDELFGPTAQREEPDDTDDLAAPTPITSAKKSRRKAARKAAEGSPDATPPTKSGKSVNKPRHVAPSKFDDAGDD